jgi:hypothetical protein
MNRPAETKTNIMKTHTFLKSESEHGETRLWAVLAAASLLAITLAFLPAFRPATSPASGAGSAPPPAQVQSPPEHHQVDRMHQLVADMRTLVAAIRYLLTPETDAANIA